MTLDEAVERAAKAYFKGAEFSNLSKQLDKRAKYVKKYFDRLEEEQFGSATTWESLRKQFRDV